MTRPDDKMLLREAIEIISNEREIIYTSYKEVDGVVRAPDAKAELRKFDRWLKKAKAAVA